MNLGDALILIIGSIVCFLGIGFKLKERKQSKELTQLQKEKALSHIEEKEKQIEKEVTDESLDEIVRMSNDRYSGKSSGSGDPESR